LFFIVLLRDAWRAFGGCWRAAHISLRRGSLGLRASPCRFSLLYTDETARLEAKDTGGKPYQPLQKKQ